eukprot:COSAG06_NODE_1537_length_9151_cov_2.179187_6_plen_78_part_00
MTSKDDGQVLDPRKSDGSTCSKAARHSYLQRQNEEQVPDPRKSDGSTCSKEARHSYLQRENKKWKEQEAAAAAGEGA